MGNLTMENLSFVRTAQQRTLPRWLWNSNLLPFPKDGKTRPELDLLVLSLTGLGLVMPCPPLSCTVYPACSCTACVGPVMSLFDLGRFNCLIWRVIERAIPQIRYPSFQCHDYEDQSLLIKSSSDQLQVDGICTSATWIWITPSSTSQ